MKFRNTIIAGTLAAATAGGLTIYQGSNHVEKTATERSTASGNPDLKTAGIIQITTGKTEGVMNKTNIGSDEYSPRMILEESLEREDPDNQVSIRNSIWFRDYAEGRITPESAVKKLRAYSEIETLKNEFPGGDGSFDLFIKANPTWQATLDINPEVADAIIVAIAKTLYVVIKTSDGSSGPIDPELYNSNRLIIGNDGLLVDPLYKDLTKISK